MNIASFLERKLNVLNAEKSISVPKEQDYIDKVRNAVVRANNLRGRVSITVNGEDVSDKVLDQAKIALPDALNKPKTFEAFGSDGSQFAIEVI